MTLSPLKRFLLLALLWLPAMFFVWVYFSSLLAVPATAMAKALLTGPFDRVVHEVYRGFPVQPGQHPDVMPVEPGTPVERGHKRDDHLLYVRLSEAVMPPAMRAEKHRSGDEPVLVINSMQYGYGLALIWGLILATPLGLSRGLLQFVVAWLAVALVQTFGVVTATLASAMQYVGKGQIQGAGIHPEVLAALYQFGYLILPAVVPVVLWMLMNRPFIQVLTTRLQEPDPQAPVQSTPDPTARETRPPD